MPAKKPKTNKQDVIEHLPWDSDFFGKKIGRYTKQVIVPADAVRLSKEFSRGKFDCVYISLKPDDYHSLRAASQNGSVLTDLRSRYTLDKKHWHLFAGSTACEILENQTAKESKEIIGLARSLATVSRFHFDPRLRAKAAPMYEIWAKKILSDPKGAIVVAREKGRIAGFIGCSFEAGQGRITLVAVDEALQGKNIGKAMLSRSLAWLFDQGAKEIFVVTQQSPRAVRLYESAGFRLEGVELVHHLWKDALRYS